MLMMQQNSQYKEIYGTLLVLSQGFSSHYLKLDLDALSGLIEISLETDQVSRFKHGTKLGVSLGPSLSKVAIPSQIPSLSKAFLEWLTNFAWKWWHGTHDLYQHWTENTSYAWDQARRANIASLTPLSKNIEMLMMIH